MFKLIFLSIFICLLFSKTSMAAGLTRAGAFVGQGYYSVGTANGIITSRESSFGYGATVEAAPNDDFGIETGFAAFRGRTQYPIFIRLWGNRTFTLALGPVADCISSDTCYIGASVAPGLNFPLFAKLNLFVEGRGMRHFSDKLTNINDHKNIFSALTGFRLLLQ